MYTNDNSLMACSKCIEVSSTSTSAQSWKEQLIVNSTFKYITFTFYLIYILIIHLLLAITQKESLNSDVNNSTKHRLFDYRIL